MLKNFGVRGVGGGWGCSSRGNLTRERNICVAHQYHNQNTVDEKAKCSQKKIREIRRYSAAQVT